MNDTFKPHPLALAVAIAVGSLPAAGWAAAAGRVQFAFGQVSVQNAGGDNNPLRKGQDVNPGDTIITESGRVQIKFSDGSLVSLQPKSTFKIDDYNFAGNDDGSERSFFSLFRGGLRTITGVIGHKNHDSYRVNTPVATIGIRGTEYLIKLDATGAIVSVGDGEIAIINDSGVVVLKNGQSGVIVDKKTPVRITYQKPVLPPPPPKDLRDDPGTNQPQQDEEDFILVTSQENGETVRLIPKGQTEPADIPVSLDNLLVGGIPVAPPPAPQMLESGPGFTVAYALYSTQTEGHVIDFADNSNATFSQGKLTGWANNNSENPSNGAIGALVLKEAGSDEFIGWTRWAADSEGGSAFTVNGPNDNENFFEKGQSVHSVAGKPTDLTALADLGETEARYKLLAHTTPTDRDGTQGVFRGGTFFLNITQALVSGSANFDMRSSHFNASSSLDRFALQFNQLPVGPGGFRGNANVNSPNGGCSSDCNGIVAGLVAGPHADRAGFVYHADTDRSNIFGAVTFTQAPDGRLPPGLNPP